MPLMKSAPGLSLGLTTDPQDTAPRSLANELFLGDSAQDDPQPPLSQSDLVLWHEREVPMRTDKAG